MSLVVMYRDEMATDTRCTMLYPHALGTIYNATKMRIAASGAFAVGVVGPTLSTKEFDVLEAILADAFKNSKESSSIVPVNHEEWFKERADMSMMVMTKRGSYYSYFPWITKDGWARDMGDCTTPALVKFVPTLPAGSGTGLYAANIALREGVKMKDLMYLVSRVVSSVGAEFDYVHRDTLKDF